MGDAALTQHSAEEMFLSLSLFHHVRPSELWLLSSGLTDRKTWCQWRAEAAVEALLGCQFSPNTTCQTAGCVWSYWQKDTKYLIIPFWPKKHYNNVGLGWFWWNDNRINGIFSCYESLLIVFWTKGKKLKATFHPSIIVPQLGHRDLLVPIIQHLLGEGRMNG